MNPYLNMYKDCKFNKEDCWSDYLKECPNYGTDKCRLDCFNYYTIFRRVNASGLPERLQYPQDLYPDECDLETFKKLNDVKNNIKDWVNKGNNLFLYSANFGNGKTTWAAKLMMAYFNRGEWKGAYEGVYIDVNNFLAESKENINDPSFVEYKKYIKQCDLLILDDIGVFPITEYEEGLLLDIINYRLNHKKSNIYTSNISLGNLETNIGSRLFSRIWNTAYVAEFKGMDKRNDQ